MQRSAPTAQRGLVRLRLAKRARGFTLIELIMVIVILGVLAVFAAPRIFNSGDFNARGFHDETLSLLRYAQKTAVAQRRTVCIALVAGPPATAKLRVASAPADPVCDASLVGPNRNCAGGPTGEQGCITAPSGVSFSTMPTGPATLSFNGLGQPTATSLTIQVANSAVPISQTITVESNTGYVHE
jgi:MSHA pilin protein MshC